MVQVPTRILLPTDGSEGSQHAAAYAGALAEALGAGIVVIHVVHPSSSEAVGMTSLSATQIQETLRHRAQPHFDSVAAHMGALQDSVAVEEIVALGDPTAEICGAARAQGCDLIVIGSRGLSQFERLRLGSVSAKVVRHAHCPVTVVR